MTLLNLNNNVGVDVIIDKAVTTFNCNNKEIDSSKIQVKQFLMLGLSAKFEFENCSSKSKTNIAQPIIDGLRS